MNSDSAFPAKLLFRNGTAFLLIGLLFFFLGCSNRKERITKPVTSIEKQPASADSEELVEATTLAHKENMFLYKDTIPVDEQYNPLDEDVQVESGAENQPKETRLRYPAFTVVFHNFKGYEPAVNESYNGNRKYYGQFGGNSEYNQADLNDQEQEQEDYVEALIVKKDTLHISEQLFDDRINNTLIQIIPKSSTDRFKLSFCYLASLNEIIDDRKLSREVAEKRYKNASHISEQTKFYEIKDSANFYFRALPHTADMEEITVKDGKIVPVKKPNTKAQIDWETKQLQEELARIKKKYQLHDTLVVIPGEYDTEATLTKNKKLYNYDYDAFLLRLERFSNQKRIETKYIVISIAYGC